MLLDRVRQFLCHEVALVLRRQISRTDCDKVDCGARVHAPSNALHDVNAKAQRLLHGHLTVVAFLRIAATLIGALRFELCAGTLHKVRLQLAEDRDVLLLERITLLAACTATLGLLVCLHNLLDVLLLFFLSLVQFRLVCFRILIVTGGLDGFFLARKLDLVVLQLEVLTLRRLVKLVVPLINHAVALPVAQ